MAKVADVYPQDRGTTVNDNRTQILAVSAVNGLTRDELRRIIAGLPGDIDG